MQVSAAIHVPFGRLEANEREEALRQLAAFAEGWEQRRKGA